MTVRRAKEVAEDWVHNEAGHLPGFVGAFYHGSINWLPDDAELSPSSDVDVMVVLDGELPDLKLGKFVYHDVLLEVSYLDNRDLASPEAVLGVSHLAGSFATLSIIADPSGRLTAMHEAVAHDYAAPEWVWRRCQHAGEKVEQYLQSIRPTAALHDNVISWVFGTSVTTHILLIAGLRNPTVRKRYLATRELLLEYGHLDLYELLLAQLGCATMSPTQVEHHLDALAEVFDVAKSYLTTPVFFASDLTDLARPIAIDGSRALIAGGLHREAVFWIVVTFARCHKVLAVDAPPDVQAAYEPAFHRLLKDLGIGTVADMQRRAREVEASLPTLWQVARGILEQNPTISD